MPVFGFNANVNKNQLLEKINGHDFFYLCQKESDPASKYCHPIRLQV
jgi:hypothetical protein